jgi:hypothetical protein
MVLEYYDDTHKIWVGLHNYPALSNKALNFSGSYGSPAPQWISWKADERNYALFGEIASVRGESSQQMVSKGLPDDCSTLARLLTNSWKSDGHNFSWLYVRDFVKCMAIANDELSALVAERLEGRTSTLDKYIEILLGETIPLEYLYKYRIVFWFDS